jgi:hypothetical protein
LAILIVSFTKVSVDLRRCVGFILQLCHDNITTNLSPPLED